MANSIAEQPRSTPRKQIDDLRPQMAKAGLVSQSVSIALTELVKDALIRHYGSLKAAAITLQMDLGQLSRELSSGDFKLKALDRDEEGKAFVIAACAEAIGKADPHAIARRMLREARARIDEAMEQIA